MIGAAMQASRGVVVSVPDSMVEKVVRSNLSGGHLILECSDKEVML